MTLNDLKYTCDEDPVEFVTRLKCKLALLEVQIKSGEVPKTDTLIKNKLLKGMPKASRKRLELYMDENVTLKRFMSKLDNERIVVMAQQRDSVRAIEPPVQQSQGAIARNSTRGTAPTGRGNLDRTEKRLRQWDRREKYCPYCQAYSHSVAEYRKQLRPGSCYDCLCMNCRRGQPGCPGRINMTRGRIA